MIKCFGYLKSLKQLFFTLLISCFILLGSSFVNAFDLSQGLYVRQNGDYGFSPYNSDFDVNVVSKGNILTQRIGMTTKSIYLQPGTYMVWQYSDSLGGIFPYLSYKLHDTRTPSVYQGFPVYYALCDEFDGNNHIADYNLSNCTVYVMDSSSKDTIISFMSSITNNDSFGFNYLYSDFTYETQYNTAGVLYCFSSSQLHKSMCFSISKFGNRGIYGDTFLPGYDSYHYQYNYDSYGLTLPSTYDELYHTYLYSSPGAVGGASIGGSSQDVVQAPITGDTMNISCTNNLAFQWYRANGYKSRMCYSSYSNNQDIFQGSGSVNDFALTGTDVLDVRFDTWDYRRGGNTGESMDYKTWFSYWRKTYEVYKKNAGTINNPFIGVPVSIFTLMGNVDAYGLPYSDESILEFCDLSLYMGDRMNQAYTGIAKSTVCSMSALQLVDIIVSNGQNPDDGFPGDGNTDGTVGDIGSSWDGITDRPGHHNKPGSNGSGSNGSGNNGSGSSGSGLATYEDGLTFQNSFFNSLKGSYKYSEKGGNGVLPGYIIIFLCALIFFRFLRH